MATNIPMPKFGLSMEEGTIEEWLVKEGDYIKKGQAIAEINSEKLTNKAESEFEGTLLKIVVQEGDTVECGTTIAIIGEAGEDISSVDTVSNVKEEAKSDSTQAIINKTVVQTATNDEVTITPKALKYAKETKLSYSHIKGTGLLGMITIADVKAKGIKEDETSVVTTDSFQISTTVSDGDKVEKMSAMQQTICKAMYNSVHGTAPARVMTEINVEELTKQYEKLKSEYSNVGIKLSYTAILVKAVAMALENHESVRVQYIDDKHIKIINKIDIGIAVDIPTGLVVPVIRDANLKDLRQICIDLSDITDRAKSGNLTPDDFGGAVTSITNLGMFNVTYCTPVLNTPESTILGIGAIFEKPVIKNGGIYIEHVMNLSLTHDHRITNGAPCARYLKEVCDNLIDFKWGA